MAGWASGALSSRPTTPANPCTVRVDLAPGNDASERGARVREAIQGRQLPTVRFGPVGDVDDLALGVKRCCLR